MQIGNGSFYHGDCLEVMRGLPDASVDMALCDLPYGTTSCSWDSVIPFEPLWAQYWRIAKPNAAVVLTASQPFTSALVMSQANAFRYGWIWEKHKPSGHLRAKLQPLRLHEDVLVFGRKTPPYFPQGTTAIEPRVIKRTNPGGVFGKQASMPSIQTVTGYPKTILKFPVDHPTVHPTQKPVALFEYLIRTYTKPGETVLDNCMGSGTTAIAAERSGRKWIGIERDAGYYNAALARIRSEVTGSGTGTLEYVRGQEVLI